MMKALKQGYSLKSTWIITAVSCVISLLYACMHQPFFLCFINALSLISVIVLLIGLVIWVESEGSLLFPAWKKELQKTGKMPQPKQPDQKKKGNNPFLYAGLLLFLTACILSLLYTA